MNAPQGTTSSERYLQRLAERTFLRFWSYPNVYRNQGDAHRGGDGKEVCDLLIVFGSTVILFSDKTCEYPQIDDVKLAWSRWYRRAIVASAKQLNGAQRWLQEHPDRLFLDRACENPIPIAVPSEDVQFHLVLVARGAKLACQQFFGGGSGSLLLCAEPRDADGCVLSDPTDDVFTIPDVNPDGPYMHVLDDVTLDIILRELDTVADFTAYLERKESFLRSKGVEVPGEEELLAIYLRKKDSDNKGTFGFPADLDAYVFEEGFWEGLLEHPQFIARKKADRISYLWDDLIEDVSGHILAGTAVNIGHTPSQQERIIRTMASEPRFQRRMLSEALLQLVESYSRKPDKAVINRRLMLSEAFPRTAYAFIVVPYRPGEDQDYRAWRQRHLMDYCLVAAWKYRANYDRVIGVLTEGGIDNPGRSHDFTLVEIDDWIDDLVAAAQRIQKEEELLLDENQSFQRVRSIEYPLPSQLPTRTMKIGRNQKCPCGSGLKFKRCCGK